MKAPGCICCGRPTRSQNGFCWQHSDMAKYLPKENTSKVARTSTIVEAALKWRTYYSGIYDDHSGSCTCRACNLIRACDEYLEEK